MGSLYRCFRRSLFSLLSSLLLLCPVSSLSPLLSSFFSPLSSLISLLSSPFSLLSSLFSLLSCLLSFFSLAEERKRTETKKSLGAPRRAHRALCGALGRPLASFGEPWDALGSSLSPQEALGESLRTPQGSHFGALGLSVSSLFPPSAPRAALRTLMFENWWFYLCKTFQNEVPEHPQDAPKT